MRNGIPTIADTIHAFIAEVQMGRSRETARTYSTGLNTLTIYLRQAHVDPQKARVRSLEPEHLIDYPAWLTGEHFRRKANPESVATYIAAVLGWMKYLNREKLHPELAAEADRIRDVYRSLRRKSRKLPRAIRPEETAAILRAAEQAPTSKLPRLRVAQLRDVALIHALRCTGARISEVLGADVEDLDMYNHTLRVTGKGTKERLVYFDRQGWKALNKYLDERSLLRFVSERKVTPLFTRHNRGAGKKLLRLTPHGARLTLWKYVKFAGLRSKITPHRFRHGFATTVLEKTGDLAATQDLLGHASPATTRIYATLVGERLRKAHQTAFPH